MSRVNAVRQGEGIHRLSDARSVEIEVPDLGIPVLEKVRFTLAEGATAPFRKRETDSGFDLTALSCKEYEKNPEILIYDTGVNVQLPEGYELQLRPRSSIRDYDLILANSPCTVDEEYRGRILVCFRKIPRADGSIRAYAVGERICQAILAYRSPCEWERVENLSETDRGSGGFGSTGL